MPYDREKRHERYLKHKKEVIAYSKDYGRHHSLKNKDGKVISGVNKRKYPSDGKCELCCGKNSVKAKRLLYHHWDDKHPEQGLWMCNFCHGIAESLDNVKDISFIIEKYKELKEKLKNAVY